MNITLCYSNNNQLEIKYSLVNINNNRIKWDNFKSTVVKLSKLNQNKGKVNLIKLFSRAKIKYINKNNKY